MATVRKEIVIDARPDDVWDALRDYGAVHERLATGFVVDAHLDGDDRIVTFGSGAVARERLVAIDEEHRRLVYSVVESPLGATHHNASAQVVADGDDRVRFVWITDVLPDHLAPVVDELMEQGARVMKQTLESQAVRR
jgi:(2Fe-2S) ferredoxin